MSAARPSLVVCLTVEEFSLLVHEQVAAALANYHPEPIAALNCEQAAHYLNMPVDVLRKRVRDGQIPHFMIGVQPRFRVADLDAAFPSGYRRRVPKKGEV